MNYICEKNNSIYIACAKCGQEHHKHKSFYKQYGDEYHFNPPIKCSACGNIGKVANKNSLFRQSYSEVKVEDQLKCPKCFSTNLTANNKGFGLGKAVVGGILIGAIGLLGGLIGSKKPVFICLNCGNQFEQGKPS